MNKENLIKKAYYQIKKEQPQDSSKSCLSDEEIAAYLTNNLTDKEKESFLTHIVTCLACSQKIKDCDQLNKSLETQKLTPVPEDVTQKILSLKNSLSIMEIILMVKEKTLKLLSTTGEILFPKGETPFAPVAQYRNQQHPTQKNIQIIHHFQELVVTAEVEHLSDKEINIIIQTRDKKTNKKINRLRVILEKEKKELESQLTENGEVQFENLKIGSYLLTLESNQKSMGTINLNLKGETEK